MKRNRIVILTICAIAILLCVGLLDNGTSVRAQPIYPIPVVYMTPHQEMQLAVFCTGGAVRMWVYESGKGLVYCEEMTPVPTRPPRPTQTPIPTKVTWFTPTSTSTPYTVNLPIVAKGN